MQIWQHICKLHIDEHSFSGLYTWWNLLLLWLKVRTVWENCMSPEVARCLVLIPIQYRIWTPWNQQVSKSTKPKLVTRTWKLHLQLNKKRPKKLWLNGDRHLELAHLDAFHCHRGFCYNTSSHLSFGGKYKQNLQTTALLSCVHEKQFWRRRSRL